jgi:APA family basic amino acid/polyamine antiporter
MLGGSIITYYMSHTNNKQQIGIWMVTSLVIGNMIASGIFLLPSALAKFGGISIFGWIISGVGALLIAMLFSRLSKLVPKTGGPYQYPKEGFGEFVGFISGWGYWGSVVLSNASIAAVFTGYFFVFIPSWQKSQIATVTITLSAIWLLTWLNSRGVRTGGKVQLVTTILKIIPLFTLTIAGLFYFNVDHFMPLNLSDQSNLGAISAAVALTLFAFLGIESATVPAGNVRDPKRTIPRATLIGTSITVVIYILSSISIMGMVPPEQLAQSTAPLADAAFMIWGETGRYIVGFGALASTFGALNGWILIQGQMPMSMAEDKLLPPIFNKLSKRDFPVTGLVISSVLISIIVLANQSKGLVELFAILILLSTFLTLVSYLFSSMAEVLILIKHKNDDWQKKLIPAFLISIPTFGFSLWAVYGSGLEVVFYGFIALMLGTPFYVWSKIEQNRIKS